MKIEKISDKQFKINDNYYSLSNQDDVNSLLCMFELTENGYPNYKKLDELIEILNNNSTKEIEETKTKIEYDDDTDEYIEEDSWDVPMPTEKNVIRDKKMNYKILGLITLISNRRTEFIEGIDISEAEQHRYIYEKGTNSILSNKDYLETISGNRYDAIKKILRKLANCNNDVVSYCQDEHGSYYRIMPYIIGENGKLQYVTIDSRILEFLCYTFSSNSIKIYCTLLWALWDNKNKCYIEKWITRDWLCEQIGLNKNSGKNKTLIGEVVATFENNGLIKRRKETEVIKVNGQNDIVKTKYYYSIGNIDEVLNKIKYH